MNLRNRKHVLIALAVAAIAMFLGGGVAAYVSRHDHIRAGGKLALKQRAFIAGGIVGVFGYFAIGAILHWSVRGLGSQGTYRRTRNVLAFAAVPIALSLVLWPVRLALYGEDVFRSGGSDTGGGAHVFTAL